MQWLAGCELHGGDSDLCQCYARPGAGVQSLDELGFVRSACHTAQT